LFILGLTWLIVVLIRIRGREWSLKRWIASTLLVAVGLEAILVFAAIFIAPKFSVVAADYNNSASGPTTAGRKDNDGFRYVENQDPVTKKTVASAIGKMSNDENIVTNVEIQCKQLTLRVTADTYSSKDEPLGQDQNKEVRYRFHGWVSDSEVHPYSNSVVVSPPVAKGEVVYAQGLTGQVTKQEPMAPGLANVPIVVGFKISDPDFVMDIPMANGQHDVVKFSLEDPAIKKLLTNCGFEFASQRE
jgi:hypothetical protein